MGALALSILRILRWSKKNQFLLVIMGALLALFWFLRFYNSSSSRSVGLEARNHSFFLNGKPLRILSGSFHYFRTHPSQWPDRLMRMKVAGLNTVTTYVPWNMHEPVKDEYDFSGPRDLFKFIRQVDRHGLHLIVRPGPYICAEWEWGGFPPWLLHDPHMVVRSSEYQPFLEHVKKYFDLLLRLLRPYTWHNGGPIIAFQLENELGSYRADRKYMSFLHDLFMKAGIQELIFTSDGPYKLNEGQHPGLLATANFNSDPKKSLTMLLNFLPPGMPLLVGEFWSGWFDHWTDEEHHVMAPEALSEKLDAILAAKASVNFYMFVGGTNFGFWNGANNDTRNGGGYQPTITSYDYDALVSESGDCHPTKFEILRKLLVKHNLVTDSDLPPIPANPMRKAYGDVTITHSMELTYLAQLAETNADSKTLVHTSPKFMEFLDINNYGGQGYGWILYRTCLNRFVSVLEIVGTMRDRAQILVDSREVATLYNPHSDLVNKRIQLTNVSIETLEILVENMGRVNYQTLNGQRRGFEGYISLDGVKTTGLKWQHIPLDFSDRLIKSIRQSIQWGPVTTGLSPTLFRGHFDIKENRLNIADTFLDMQRWKKGIAIVNEVNLGRYWNVGPQQTLYVPAPILVHGKNEVIIFELHGSSHEIKSVDEPILNMVQV